MPCLIASEMMISLLVMVKTSKIFLLDRPGGLQRAGCFDKMGVAADRAATLARVLGLAALTGAKPIFIPRCVGGRCRACNVFQAVKHLRRCHALRPEPIGQPVKLFAVVSFMVSFLLLSGYSACGVRLCAVSLAVSAW